MDSRVLKASILEHTRVDQASCPGRFGWWWLEVSVVTIQTVARLGESGRQASAQVWYSGATCLSLGGTRERVSVLA